MATFYPRSVRASQENVMGVASDKKEVQEQVCYVLCDFLPMLTAKRKTKPRPSMEKRGHCRRCRSYFFFKPLTMK